MNKQANGFTVIEMLFVSVLLGIASVFFFIQKSNLEVLSRDDKRKTSINAIYYSLEEVFYPVNKYYPRTVTSDNLKSLDPALFIDTNDIKIGEAGSIYTYEPVNCSNDQCKGYTLKTVLENEADFIKTNRDN